MSLRHLTAVIAAASGLALIPLPAHAATITTHDAARDVMSQGLTDDVAEDPAPQRVEGDVLALRVKHGRHNVRATLRLAQLTRDPKSDLAHVFSFRTNEDRRANLTLYVAKRNWQGRQMWSVGNRKPMCRGLRTHIDYRHATVTAVVPRSCLSNPRWVEVGGGNGFLVGGDRLYADDANLDAKVGDDEPTYGPRVRRG